MKKLLLIKTVMLLMCLVGGAGFSWAENVSIPQDMGSYIVIGSSTGADGFASYITKTNCQVDSRLGDATNNKYYSIGSTKSDTKVTFNITASEAGDYVFGFKSGASGCSSVVTVKLTKVGSDKPTYNQDITIANDGNWDPNVSHVLHFTGLEAADYTLQFDVKSITSGSYAGNFGNFYFHKMSQLAWATSSSYMELSDGTFKNARDNSDNVINYISRTGGYIDDLLINNSEASSKLFHFNIDAYKQTSTVTITISDFGTGANAITATTSVTASGDYICPLPAQVTAGLKKVRFDFADADDTADNDYLYNFRQVYFTDIEAMPLMSSSTTYLDLSQWPTSGNPRYQSNNQNLGYIYHGNTAYFYVYNSSENAYYNICAGISTNVSDANLKVTVTDVATASNEVEETFDVPVSSNYATQTFKLTNAVSAGVKKITFDFTKDDETTSNWLYNINNITFYKRSLNEAYDYTPVAATGVDVVLTRTLPADKWATIVLPFAMSSSQITSAFGENVQVAQLTNESTADMLKFSTVTAMSANQPYAIKVASDFSSATINGVTIAEATPTQSLTSWDFVGTYASGNIPQDSYFFSANQLWKATDNTNTIKPFRAYFTPKGVGARELKFTIDGNGTSSIGTVMTDGTLETTAEGTVYNLSGQRVNKPAKGLYVINGKKMIIK